MEQQIAQLYNPLFLYVRNRINNQEDAKDLTQEVFYKLAKSERGKVENMKSWLYTIAKNTITDFYRKKKINTQEYEDVLYETEEISEEETQALVRCVAPFIDKLPKDYRQIMIMSELEGIPQKEIAKQLNMNYVTVRSKVQRGRKKLKDVFTDCCTIIQGGKGKILGYVRNDECGRGKCKK